MRFFADLHIHSRFSRATSRQCDLENIALWARRKGIAVVGTGDFTHPGWMAEIREKLVPAEPGLFRLTPELEAAIDARLAGAAPGAGVRFQLTVEISTIYKKGDRVRKVHHVINAASLETAERLRAALERIGNLASDGRPILGLDSRDLLEITLASGPDAYLVPAHIWTPWFSMLGSKSGFDGVAECYGNLAGHIFALETGLSSDPPMNWRISGLDRYRLVSNSDAHSPAKLGREATIFETERDYFAMRRALETGAGYAGTVEFFPEEGKYHLDGHRKCNARLEPGQTRERGGLCPVCGKPVTVGVLSRVEALADRIAPRAPATAGDFLSLVPLSEIIAEIEQVGAGGARVGRAYETLIRRLGPELDILESIPLEEIRRQGSTLLAEGIDRLRRGQVIRSGGYDGAYGVIRLFEAGELDRAPVSGVLFEPDQLGAPQPRPNKPAAPVSASAWDGLSEVTSDGSAESAPESSTFAHVPPEPGADLLGGLDADQRAAAGAGAGPLLIVAGPGTGKTRVITHRIAHLIRDRGVAPAACLAVTFTRRAAGEMAERLRVLLGREGKAVTVKTFHALAWSLLREHHQRLGYAAVPAIASEGLAATLAAEVWGISAAKARKRLAALSADRDRGTTGGVAFVGAGGAEPAEGIGGIGGAGAAGGVGQVGQTGGAGGVAQADQAGGGADWLSLRAALMERGRLLVGDLIDQALLLLRGNPDIAEGLRRRFSWVTVDEFQDIDPAQYALLQLLVPEAGNLCVIGDPDQAIYGFRGGDAAVFEALARDWPTLRTVQLTRGYRSRPAILNAALQVVAVDCRQRMLTPVRPPGALVALHEAASERSEAAFIAKAIEKLIGGHSFHALDSGRSDGSARGLLGFADFAILYRADLQAPALIEALSKAGIPFQKHSHHPLIDHPGARELLARMADRPGEMPVLARLEQAALLAAQRRADGDDAGGPDGSGLLGLLAPLARDCGSDWAAFESRLRMAAEVELMDPRADRVSLLTLHAAKGLEFDVVFIAGCEDGLLPLRWGDAPPEDEPEERRLFFVGMTRARERLILTRARKRLWRGRRVERGPSPFLSAIDAALIQPTEAVKRPARKKPPRQKQFSLFD